MADYSLKLPIIDISVRNPVMLDHSLPIGEVLKYFAYNQILSAPIRNTTNDNIIGSVDVLDILTYIIFTLKDKHDPAKVKQLFREPVISAVDASSANPFLPVMDSTSIEDVITSHFSIGVHRLPIVNENDTIVGLCTQSDVISFLLLLINENADPKLTQLGSRTLSQLDVVPGNVISVVDTVSMLEAFKLLIANSINGLAIVNSVGQIVSNLSASDFKGVTEDNFLDLQKPLVSFLPPQGTRPVLYLRRDSTYLDALKMLDSWKIHRVYVVDDELKPIGLFTMTDAFKILVHNLRLKP